MTVAHSIFSMLFSFIICVLCKNTFKVKKKSYSLYVDNNCEGSHDKIQWDISPVLIDVLL